MLWPVAPPVAPQAEAAPPPVQFASNAAPSAPGGTSGPSDHHAEEEDPFVTVSPPNQVSNYFLTFVNIFLTN